MKVKIEIDTKTFIRFLVVISAFVGTVFLLWQLWPVLLILAVSFFLAIALNKPVVALSQHMPRKSRLSAAGVVYTVFLVVVGVFAFLAVPPIVNQTNIFINSIPGHLQSLSTQQTAVADLVNKYQLQDEIDKAVQGAQDQIGSIAQGIGTNVVAGVSSLIGAFATIVSVLVLTFLMIIEGPRWIERLWTLYRDKAKMTRHQKLFGRMYRVVTGYVNGQALVATIAATLAAITLFILSTLFLVPTSAILPLAMVVLFTSLIPMIGATIGASIALLVLVFNDLGSAVAFLIYFLIYQQIENNVIQPAVQSRTVELSALTVFVSVLFGVVLVGPVGGILAIPVAGCIRAWLIDYMEHRHIGEGPKPKHPLHKLATKAK